MNRKNNTMTDYYYATFFYFFFYLNTIVQYVNCSFTLSTNNLFSKYDTIKFNK